MTAELPLSANEAKCLALPKETHRVEAGIVSRTLLNADSLRVVLFSIAADQELTEHTSTRRALVHILEGSCDFLFNGSWTRLESGGLLHMPPGHVHAVKAHDKGCVFLLTLTP